MRWQCSARSLVPGIPAVWIATPQGLAVQCTAAGSAVHSRRQCAAQPLGQTSCAPHSCWPSAAQPLGPGIPASLHMHGPCPHPSPHTECPALFIPPPPFAPPPPPASITPPPFAPTPASITPPPFAHPPPSTTPPPPPPHSPPPLQRLERIRRNQAMLEELGIARAASDLAATAHQQQQGQQGRGGGAAGAPPAPRRRRPPLLPGPAGEQRPTRQSARQRGQLPAAAQAAAEAAPEAAAGDAAAAGESGTGPHAGVQ